MEIKEHEFCLRCGRKLRNKQTREVGYGAVCLKKLQVEDSKRLFKIGSNLQSSSKEKDLH